MQAPDRPSRYYAYVLRLWEQQDGGPGHAADWRCCLEDPHTGARRGFASLAALMAFLQDELARRRWTAELGEQSPSNAAEENLTVCVRTTFFLIFISARLGITG